MNGEQAVRRVFEQCRAAQTSALIPFLALGDPDYVTTRALARAVVDAGADVLELGLPFSDSLADGPVVQAAYCRALTNGAALDDGFTCIADIAASVPVPIVLMVTYNIVLRRGVETFCSDAARAGVSGLLIPDLLVEDADAVRAAAERYGLATVLLAGPDTDDERLQYIARAATGFVYLIRRRGITGTGGAADNLEQRIAVLRSCSDVPIAVGFGITTPEDVQEVCQLADGVIVGSVLLSVAPDVGAVSALTRSFARARIRLPAAAMPAPSA